MLVVDANFAVDAALGSFVRQPFLEVLEKGEAVVVPHVFFSEVTNVVWQYVRSGILDLKEATANQEEAFAFVDEVADDGELAKEALAEAAKRDHPAYDLFCLVLARRNNATLCTLDKKLQTLCMKEGISLVCPA